MGLQVGLIASTQFHAETAIAMVGEKWTPSTTAHASNLAEFAGRACYESWHKPNPLTASNAGYLANITEQKHFNVMEHGVASFYVVGVSRSCTHEIVRHRHHSPSQRSQRFTDERFDVKELDDEEGAPFVVPPLFYRNGRALAVLHQAWEASQKAYAELVTIGDEVLQGYGVTKPRERRKGAREAARAVLPNMQETRLVLTANHRAWRHFFEVRGSIHADREIRLLALEIFGILKDLEPNLYQDMDVFEWPTLDANKNVTHMEPVIMNVLEWEELEF